LTIRTETVPVTAARPEPSIRARRIAVLASDGVDDDALAQVVRTMSARGATTQLVAPRPGSLRTASGVELRVDLSLITTRSLAFDAVIVPDGERAMRELRWDPRAWIFLTEACQNMRPILAAGHACQLFESDLDDRLPVCPDGQVILAPLGVTHGVLCSFITTIAETSEARARRSPALAVASFT
jgi:putative intracellular protease/amidase